MSETPSGATPYNEMKTLGIMSDFMSEKVGNRRLHAETNALLNWSNYVCKSVRCNVRQRGG